MSIGYALGNGMLAARSYENWTEVIAAYAASIPCNTVYAFEPSPRNVEVLRRNIAANDLQHVIAHGYAVSDKVGSAKLFLNAADGQQNLLSDQILPTKNDLQHILEGAGFHTRLNWDGRSPLGYMYAWQD